MYSGDASIKREGGKARNSNLELMRIVTMLGIIAHHYVVNSNVADVYDFQLLPAKTIFLQVWGMFGKSGINAFILLSSYFMCKSDLTVKRYLKVLVPILFYRLAAVLVGGVLSLRAITLGSLVGVFSDLLKNAGQNGSFTASIAVFYCLLPVLKSITDALSDEGLKRVTVTTITLTTLLGQLFQNDYLFNEVLWFCLLFFLAAFIRRAPLAWMSDFRVAALGLAVSIIVSALSILAIDTAFPESSYYYLISDPSRVGSLLMGVFCFLFFLNLRIDFNQTINTVASHVFGALLFHANWVGRIVLWQPGGLFDTSKAYLDLMLPGLIGHSLFAVLTVFSVGVLVNAFVASPVVNKTIDAVDGWITRKPVAAKNN